SSSYLSISKWESPTSYLGDSFEAPEFVRESDSYRQEKLCADGIVFPLYVENSLSASKALNMLIQNYRPQ
ncbi:MAG: hypothetical protein ACRC1D_07580, partial [Culicoidibacterales bacterium]